MALRDEVEAQQEHLNRARDTAQNLSERSMTYGYQLGIIRAVLAGEFK